MKLELRIAASIFMRGSDSAWGEKITGIDTAPAPTNLYAKPKFQLNLKTLMFF
jgi:hypothetical protein